MGRLRAAKGQKGTLKERTMVVDTQPDAVYIRMAHKIRTHPYSLGALKRMLRGALAQAHEVLERAGDDAPARRLDALQAVAELAALLARLDGLRRQKGAGNGST